MARCKLPPGSLIFNFGAPEMKYNAPRWQNGKLSGLPPPPFSRLLLPRCAAAATRDYGIIGFEWGCALAFNGGGMTRWLWLVGIRPYFIIATDAQPTVFSDCNLLFEYVCMCMYVCMPETEERQPEIEERQPETEERQPDTEERQPETEERQPETEERQAARD